MKVSRVRGLACALPFSLLAVLALSGCGGKEDEKKGPPPIPEVGFVTVRTQSVPLVAELAGRTAAYETSEVRPQVSGIIKARLFTEGTVVREGQTLYQIDPRLYRATAAEAQANVASARAAETAARVRADRLRPLAQIEAVAQQDYTDAAATAAQARATIAQNRAQLDTAQINLAFTRVPAPITGRIGRSLFTTGALVTASQADPLTTIQRLDPIFVDIQQSSAELLTLRRALASGGVVPTSGTVRLKLEDGSDYGRTGTVQFAEVTVDQNTGTVTLRARFPNPDGLLLPGMYVRAILAQSSDTNAILVPQAGIARDPKGQATAFVVGPNNKAVMRVVQTSRTIGSNWLVTGGLKPGDRVITEGLAKLKPNQTVRPVPAGSKPRAQPAPAGAAQPKGN
ncbi:efflux RND transporter periplasmic adaptor subunit [Sphingomonas prati]|uniref:Membrane fusion protein (Multidrug efflux system) n=1 Tax=Sphingomonas prati TaxID=1843237 RepID=A0A7W9BTB8_9SPHN|nr:efflux RND transporter periplasmic adaptor subunit [Sphingomonas prati]MBB5729735.1 membrane fusion protein (multidrug efflux system) [Sphingomonas prati]GGE89890.1 MexE family multidrug efflux RND transporter periplasmic adaptor subunit [Sphingomonas prati]